MANGKNDETKLMAPQTALRPLNCEIDALTRPDGSVVFSQGSTCVAVSITTPTKVKLRPLYGKKTYVECVYRSKRGQITINDKIRAAIIEDVCKMCLPLEMRSSNKIALQLQELINRGGLVACGINAVCLALIIGGVPMKFTVAAVHCIIDDNDCLILDPELLTKRSCHKTGFTFVFDSLERDIINVHTSGSFKMAQFQQACAMCRTASEEIFQFYRSIIAKLHNDTHTPKDVNKIEESTII